MEVVLTLIMPALLSFSWFYMQMIAIFEVIFPIQSKFTISIYMQMYNVSIKFPTVQLQWAEYVTYHHFWTVLHITKKLKILRLNMVKLVSTSLHFNNKNAFQQDVQRPRQWPSTLHPLCTTPITSLCTTPITSPLYHTSYPLNHIPRL